MAFQITPEYIKALSQHLEDKHFPGVESLLLDLHPADVAEIAQQLDSHEVLALMQSLRPERFSDIIVYFDEDLRGEILENYTGKQIAQVVVDNMDTDDAADLISELPEEKKREVLSNLENLELAKDLADLLTHAEGTAGSLMATELVKVNENWTVLRCVREMRRQAEEVEVVHAVYVIDDNDMLLGSLSLKKLLTTSTRTHISEVFERQVRAVTSTTEDQEVARIMKKYDLFVIPVVDDLGRLLGRITLDDVVDVIQEEADSNYQLMSGLSDEVSNDDGLFETTRARLPWLLVGLLGGVLTSSVIAGNGKTLFDTPEIAFFMPLIAAMGGNVGVQSSAIVVQAIASSTLQKKLWTRLSRELGVGLFNGLICASVILLYSWGMGHGLLFATTVGGSLLAVIIFASLFGTAIPWVLHHYGVDPALATGPFITTTNDVLGLSIYFAIANALL
ncbi:MAG TPA: magnesium transporter [Cryomorphaceae bacterium]|jgi:magnesium transporter|nr:MAG: magnesium transporter [Cryomorphaceae bacterium BACL7 MAG-120910-bin2]KRO69630.1 MAG: magnesium transporter [Cryomorphaceae bacterium BACL7 MAG-120322-bin74]KRO82622.1 MAG: magnesium transporter [Cryomorphaceae bacterium BACL7 MAG-121220-bin83]NQW25300.1 magnesium transporter [Cryomorphaceae bacterium]HAG49348.1 magnesium transporter [Cryomorphaceae bacterium]